MRDGKVESGDRNEAIVEDDGGAHAISGGGARNAVNTCYTDSNV